MRWSAHIPTKFHVLRRTLDPTRVMYKFEYGTLTLYGLLSQVVSLSYIYLTSWSEPQPIGWFRLFPVRSPLLRESIYYLSFPSGTEMFHFPEYHLPILLYRDSMDYMLGCPIRKSTDRSSHPAPHRLSQVVASFIVF